MIQVFPADSPDQSFDERMRPGNLRYRSHYLYSQDSEVGFPAPELEGGIVIKTDPNG
jgi:hypothetical protein